MAVLVIALVAGLVVGLARGGSLAALGRVRVVRPWLILAAVAALVAGALGGGGLYAVTSVAAVVLVGFFLAANRRLPGLGLLALGLALNALVVVVNAAMPVSLHAAARAGVNVTSLVDDPRHVAADSSTRLRPLGDVVAVPLPGLATVVSPGDVVIAAGLLLFAAVAPVRARRTLDQRRGALLEPDPADVPQHERPARVPAARPDDADPPTDPGPLAPPAPPPARSAPLPSSAPPPSAPGDITVEQVGGPAPD